MQHLLVAEKAFGRPIPPGAMVHHVNEDRSDNTPSNLVLCEDHAYHMFLHQRMRAKKACGNANWKKCKYCREYDDPENMSLGKAPHWNTYHKTCAAQYQLDRSAG